MIVRRFDTWAGIVAGAWIAAHALTLPQTRRLPKPGRVRLDGVTTIDDAVQACLRTHRQGWDLVTYAQQLTARKFTYSRLNPWDSPARAFIRGMGYCEQQALALKAIYDRLGITARVVSCLHCRFPADVIDDMPWPGGVTGHAWLRVTINGEERDVCPGALTNTPGVTHFTVVGLVFTLRPWMRPFTHLGSVFENARRDWLARRALRAASVPSRSRSMHDEEAKADAERR